MKPVSVSSVALISAIATSVAADASHFEPTTLNAPFLEQFNDSWESRWSPSHAVKQTPVNAEKETFSYVGQWSVEEPTVFPGIPGDKGLVIKSKAAHHAISAPIQPAVRIEEGKPLVVQYETKLQKGLECGGAYMKLLSEGQGDIGSAEFSDKTPFTIMFGPDKCGSTNKVHFIFRHANPLTGEYEEKHLHATPSPKITKTTALYTLIINPDNTFEILINDESVTTGSLLEDFEPPVNPAKEIDDPSDFKPADWVDEAEIQDPEATKPADWNEDAPAMIVDEEASIPEGWLSNEPEVIPDPDAEKPEEWDDEEDGDWIAPSVSNPLCEEAPGCGPWSQPLIPNPSYRGKWSAPLIDNPSYKGIWAPRRIANPAYFEDLQPAKSLTPIGGVGFEIWTMTEDMLFDNVYIGHSPSDAKALAQETFHTKSALEKEAEKAFLGDEDENDSHDGSKGKNGPFYEPYFSQAQEKVREFVEEMNEGNIKDAVMNHPMTAGMLGAALLTLLGFLSTIMSLLSGGGLPPAQSTPPKPVKSTKPTTTTTVVTEEKLVLLPDEVAADQSPAPVLLAPEVELESTGVRERVSKGKGREQL